ncbi:hypothetical protein MYRA21_0138 [Myroides sp. A21]|uniref:hypothetical protein n=1 Tax=Myroides sp. A21 TaxID=1583100 RepID=UPI000585D296|nr:hypothetical protein [Myroides sp. A21]AJA67382.1 hypothetical protein MYRA21_0138 [Myroides sp. A21]
MSFAVVAMLSIGAFSVNASNNDQVVKEETAVLAQVPYTGKLHYKVGNLYPEAGITNLEICTLEGTSIPYYEDVDGQNERMYGWDSIQGRYLPLFEITQ